MKLHKPYLNKLFFPEVITENNSGITITFDDGPSDSTLKILELLDKLQIKATFFVTGKNIEKHYTAFEAIRKKGHQIANHSFFHFSAFKVSANFYINSAIINARLTQSKLFRPPYGHLTPYTYKILKRKFKIILWSYMTFDFIGYTQIKQSYIKDKVIIVLHDKSNTFNIIEKQLIQIKEIAFNKNIKFRLL